MASAPPEYQLAGNFLPPTMYNSPIHNIGTSPPPPGIIIPPGPAPTAPLKPAIPGSLPCDWMVMPQNISNCPAGLEYLTQIDQMLIHQEVEYLELMHGYETENKYTIRNSVGQKVYLAAEESACCARYCCGPRRPYDIRILDNYGTPVVHINRPLACQSCCFPCCLQKLEISAPPGTLAGTIEQEWTLFCPKFSIKNASGDTVLYIKGPCCTISCCGDIDFKIVSINGEVEVGKITKKWTGFEKEAFTDADNFSIKFPMDLDVRMKAVMIGACFLIDMMYFESSPKKAKTQQIRR